MSNNHGIFYLLYLFIAIAFVHLMAEVNAIVISVIWALIIYTLQWLLIYILKRDNNYVDPWQFKLITAVKSPIINKLQFLVYFLAWGVIFEVLFNLEPSLISTIIITQVPIYFLFYLLHAKR